MGKGDDDCCYGICLDEGDFGYSRKHLMYLMKDEGDLVMLDYEND
jgi:hypothetical protein